jgi:hypothetical protein
VQVVQAPQNADSSEEEHEDDNEEEPDIDDSEILAELPDDTEVCVVGWGTSPSARAFFFVFFFPFFVCVQLRS